MTALRYLVAFAWGAVLYGLCYHPWLDYSARERSQTATGFLLLAGGAFVGALALAWGARLHRYRLAWSVLGGTWAANALVVALDWRTDPTSHNLLPFEFVILAIVASPAFLGAALGGRK